MLFTGYADIQAVINAVNEGHIFRYILKPWDTVELEGIIRQAAEQYDLLAERKRLIAELQAANAQLVAGQRGAGPGRPAQDGVHRGRQPRVQHADHPGPGPDASCSSWPIPTGPTTSGRSSARSPPAAGSLSRLVTNMLTLLRADDFRRTLQRSPVDLVELLRGSSTRSGRSSTARQLAASSSTWRRTWAPSRSTPTRSAPCSSTC